MPVRVVDVFLLEGKDVTIPDETVDDPDLPAVQIDCKCVQFRVEFQRGLSSESAAESGSAA